jgi:hypothetical protein
MHSSKLKRSLKAIHSKSSLKARNFDEESYIVLKMRIFHQHEKDVSSKCTSTPTTDNGKEILS